MISSQGLGNSLSINSKVTIGVVSSVFLIIFCITVYFKVYRHKYQPKVIKACDLESIYYDNDIDGYYLNRSFSNAFVSRQVNNVSNNCNTDPRNIYSKQLHVAPNYDLENRYTENESAVLNFPNPVHVRP